MSRFAHFSAAERISIKAALAARRAALAPKAREDNPWQDPDAIEEIRALSAMDHEIQSADEDEELAALHEPSDED